MATPRDDAHLVETPSNTFYPPDPDYRNNLMLARWGRESKGAVPATGRAPWREFTDYWRCEDTRCVAARKMRGQALPRCRVTAAEKLESLGVDHLWAPQSVSELKGLCQIRTR